MNRVVGDVAWQENDFLTWKVARVKPFSCKLYFANGAEFDRVAKILQHRALSKIEQFLLAQRLFNLTGRELAAARAYINSYLLTKTRDNRAPRKSNVARRKEKENAC